MKKDSKTKKYLCGEKWSGGNICIYIYSQKPSFANR